MILVWNDVKSFNRHLENMRAFRQLHQANAKCEWNLIKDMPMPHDVQPSSNAGGVNRFFNSSGRAIVVPIWEITLPRGLQN
jgi:malate synthase